MARTALRLGFAVVTSLTLVAAAAAERSGLEPISEKTWDYAKARHLLARAGFGGTPEEVEKLHKMGLQKAVDSLVDFNKQPAPDIPLVADFQQPAGRKRLDPKTLAKLSPAERKKALKKQREQQVKQRKNERQQFTELRNSWIRRMVTSRRPLEEKLVLFWHGHFATGYRTVKNTRAMHRQNEMFRRQAAGNFGKLLHGIVHDPAMLRYLDNDKNVKAHPNENLAREILELFSMGEGNYTEQDIKEAARALTGYTFDRRSGEPVFRANVHDNGEKTIFGKTGNWDGDKLADLILQQPATAKFIARKLFIFFVHEEPSEQTVERLAGVLRKNDYELKPLLETIFLSEEFYSSRAMGTQIKSPVQLVIGSLRNLGLRQANYAGLAAATQSMGQELLQPPNVKGWDGGRTWINTNTLFTRHNFAAPLLARGGKSQRRPKGSGKRALPGVRIDVIGLLQDKNLKTAAEVVDYLAKACFVVELNDAKRKQLAEFLNANQPLPPSSEWNSKRNQVDAKLRALLVLMMSLPEYQLT